MSCIIANVLQTKVDVWMLIVINLQLNTRLTTLVIVNIFELQRVIC